VVLEPSCGGWWSGKPAGSSLVGLQGGDLVGLWAAPWQASRLWQCGGGSLPALSVHHGVEKPSTG
jgi:hypothetical protein